MKGEQIAVKAKEILGTTGTRIYGGYIYEEYLAELLSFERAHIFDQMRRQDPTIGQLINGISHTLSSMTPSIEIKDFYTDVSGAKDQKEFISHMLFDNLNRSFEEILNDIYKNNIYGYSLFEGLWKNETSSTYGDITTIKDFLWRSPKTIWEWKLNKDEQLDHIIQRAYGDSQEHEAKIPYSNAFLFSLDREGNLFEGISPLRRVYGAWKIKQTMLRLLVIGSERYAIPQVLFKSAIAGRDNAVQKNLIQAIMEYKSGAQSFLIVPSQYEQLDLKLNFDPEKLIKGIMFCNDEIIQEANLQFLRMKEGGSHALGKSILQFFYNLMDSRGLNTSRVFNNRVIPALLKYNRPNEPVMCELKFSAAGQSVSKEYSETLANLKNSNILTPDENLESFIRKNLNVPQLDEATARTEAKEGLVEGKDPMPQEKKKDKKDDKKGEFAKKKIKKPPELIKNGYKSIEEAVDRAISKEPEKLIKKLVVNAKKKDEKERVRLPELKASKENIRRILNNELISLYNHAATNAKQELIFENNKRGLQDTGLFTSGTGKIKTQGNAVLISNLLAEEIENTLGGSYLSYIDQKDQAELSQKLIEGTKGIKNKKAVLNGSQLAVIQTVANARHDYWKTIEKKIESYTFLNDAPVTQICTYLNGKTMAANRLDHVPPEHWGCKSYLVPNLKAWKNNPKIDKLNLTKAMKKEIQF